jgi:hypothetical protein
VSLETMEAAGLDAVQWLIPLDELLPHVPAVVLNERGLRRASHGNDLAPGDFVLPASGIEAEAGTSRPRWRLLGDGGALVGIAEMQPGGLLHPVVILV